jgi:Na+-driven multidrug efflux pump
MSLRNMPCTITSKHYANQAQGAYTTLEDYVATVPLALLLCLRKDLKLVGLWAGCAVGSSCTTVLEGVYIYHYKWRRAIEDAKGREE